MKKVLVIGEDCEDIFIYGKCTRLNPEAPTPVFIPNREETNRGMAGNTFVNLKHLGLDVTMVGEGIQGPIKKNRYVDEVSNYILLRVDTGEEHIQPINFNELLKNYDLNSYDAVVISDYGKGLVDEHTLEHLLINCKSNGIPTFMDTKKALDEWATECDFIKINELEFNNPNHSTILKTPKFKGKLIITLGSDGCVWDGEEFPINKVPVRDVVGAGDTFLASFVYGYLKTKNTREAIKLANRLASDVVSKKGVALPDLKLL